MNRQYHHLIATALVLACSAAGVSAQQPAVQAAPIAHDTIDGTAWLGTIKSVTGSTTFGLEFRRSPKGALFLIEYLPAMHLYSQVVSRVTVRDGEYVLQDLPGSARLDGHTLRGVALFAKMPFELERVAKLPAPADTSVGAFGAAPAPRWTHQLGAGAWASPVVHGGTVYVGTVDGRFHAVRGSDGNELWTWTDSVPIYGEALVTGDAVFFVNDRSELVRLDRARGTLSWRVPLDSARRAVSKLPDDDTFSHRTAAPIMVDKLLYVGSTDGSMRAMDPRTGETKWRATVGAKIVAPAVSAGDKIVVGTFDGTLLGLARADGHQVWHRQFAGAIVSAPVSSGAVVVAGARDYLMHAVRLADGADVWTQHFWASWVESTPRIVDGVMYVGSSDLREVRALDPATGKVRWSTDVFGVAWGSPVVTERAVYMGVASVNGYMIAHHPSLVALDRRTGAIRWRLADPVKAGESVSGYTGSPALANGSIYAAGVDGKMIALPAP